MGVFPLLPHLNWFQITWRPQQIIHLKLAVIAKCFYGHERGVLQKPLWNSFVPAQLPQAKIFDKYSMFKFQRMDVETSIFVIFESSPSLAGQDMPQVLFDPDAQSLK